MVDSRSGISNSSPLPVLRRSELSFSSTCPNDSVIAHNHLTGAFASAKIHLSLLKFRLMLLDASEL